jgi:putative effector of murein hydrolase
MSVLAKVASGPWEALHSFKWIWILLTIAVYALALGLIAWRRTLQWLNPLVAAIAALVLILLAMGVSYAEYFKGVRIIHELLGPATVALAIPLARQLRRMQGKIVGVALCAGIGATASILTGWLVATVLGVSADALVPLSVKSITMPIALAISESAGAVVSLSAVFVMLTGLVGSLLAQPTLALMRMRDAKCIGFSLGVCAHGIGVARAFQADPEAGSWAVLGMGMAAILASVILPVALRLPMA